MKTRLSQGKVTLAVADPDPISTSLLSDALEKSEDIEVIGRISKADELESVLSSHSPDILLLGIHFKAVVDSHCARLAALLASHPGMACIVRMDTSAPEIVIDAFRAGAKGVFVCADADIELLRKCIRHVAEGQMWVERAHMGYLVSAVPEVHWKEAAERRQTSSVLTPREEEVVQLLADGLRNREIAARLGLSDNTVKNYIFRIFEKLGFSNRVEVVLYATARQQEQERLTQVAVQQSASNLVGRPRERRPD